MRFVPQQFFPSSDRPELLVDLQLPENASIYATRRRRRRGSTRMLKGDRGRRALEHLCRARRRPLLSAAERPAAQRLLRPGAWSSPRAWRSASGCKAKLETGAGRRVSRASSAASIRSSSARPSAGRCNTASAGRIRTQVREIAFQARRRSSATNPSRETSISTGSSRRARCAITGRPGPGAAARPQLAGPVPDPQRGRCPASTITQMRDGIYLVDVVVARATRRAAHVARHDPHACRCRCPTAAAVPLRQIAAFRVRPGISADLAPRPDADADRAGRRARRASCRRRVVAGAGAGRSTTLNARLPQGYHIADGRHRSRKAPRRRPR